MDIRQLKGIATLASCMTAVLWVAGTGAIPSSLEIIRLALLAALLLAMRVLFLKDIPSPTASGAIVMANGIFINGAIIEFPLLDGLAQSFVLILFLLLLFIAASYLADVVRGRAFEAHFAHPVGRFAVGTWIAGTSVCGVALCLRLPDWKPLVQFMVIGNLGLWLYFVYRAMGSFVRFFLDGPKHKVHGVLLLSTVSTQSLVIVWKAAFGDSSIYRLVAPWAILLGLVFYFVSFFLIVKRYWREGGDFDLDRDWFNTNCITHGAMSITGLASTVCEVVPGGLTLLIWLWAVSWFFLIEAVEIARAVKRTSLYGLSKGLLVYDPTQWSRNFTFGMLYAFTWNFNLAQSVSAGSFLPVFRQAFLDSLAWVVLLFLLVEICIFFRDRLALAPVATETSN